jgi:hypothetical protein
MKTHTPFELSGYHEEDYFLEPSDMTEDQWNTLMSCHHQGACDDDAEFATKQFLIKDLVKAVNYVIDCGVERERFGVATKERVKDLKEIGDTHAVQIYYLWILSGDIQERMNEEKDA